VIYNFVSTYNNPNSKRRLKKMTREFFIQECYKEINKLIIDFTLDELDSMKKQIRYWILIRIVSY
jgi:hypothetical protein